MPEKITILINRFDASRNQLVAAVKSDASDAEIKELDDHISEIYSQILQTTPDTKDETKQLIEFLLNQLAYFNELTTDQPEIPIIKKLISKL